MPCFVLKTDIKHYFQEVNYEILLKVINRKINKKGFGAMSAWISVDDINRIKANPKT